MRRQILPAGYMLCHVLLFTALFLPPVFVPNHTMADGGEYGLWLVIRLWPLASLGAGILGALIPGVSRPVRILSPAAGMGIALVCLCLLGSEAPWLGIVYGIIYAAGFFAVRGMYTLVRSFVGGYREFRGKGAGK